MSDQTPIGLALHDRVRDEHPDLEELVRSSTAAGGRIRRRRQAGAALAGVAGIAVVTTGVAALQGSERPAGEQLPVASEATTTAPTPTPTQDPDPAGGAAPVSVDAPGWDCTRPRDEKFVCSSDGATVVVNWRPAESHADYQDPDKADSLRGVHTFVSEIHGPWFATVAPALGTTQAEVDEVGARLVWAPELS